MSLIRRNRKTFPFTNTLPTTTKSDMFWRQELERLYKFIEQELTDDFNLLASNSGGSAGVSSWNDLEDKPVVLEALGNLANALGFLYNNGAGILSYVNGASYVTYNPAISGLTATDVQAALDEIKGLIGSSSSVDIRDVWLMQ
jgi:hypothetical protein